MLRLIKRLFTINEFYDRYDQLGYLEEKLEEVIRIHNYDEDLGLKVEDRDMVKFMVFNKQRFLEEQPRYKERLFIREYVYLIPFHVMQEIQEKIMRGYYDEDLEDADFIRDVSEVCNNISEKYNDICNSFPDIFSNYYELKDYYAEEYPYLRYRDIVWIKMADMKRNHNDDEISEFVKSLKYDEFLKTIYWKNIKEDKTYFSDKCELCGSKEKLHVHHRNYDNHGLEHKREVQDNDLMVVCETCHKKIHGFIICKYGVFMDKEKLKTTK